MPETAPRPFEFRPQAGLNDPSINFYVNGEIQRQVLDFPRKEERIITASRVARALEEAVAFGIQLGHLATREEKPKRAKKAPVVQGDQS